VVRAHGSFYGFRGLRRGFRTFEARGHGPDSRGKSHTCIPASREEPHDVARSKPK
jgi:hypothetical protein